MLYTLRVEFGFVVSIPCVVLVGRLHRYLVVLVVGVQLVILIHVVHEIYVTRLV